MLRVVLGGLSALAILVIAWFLFREDLFPSEAPPETPTRRVAEAPPPPRPAPVDPPAPPPARPLPTVSPPAPPPPPSLPALADSDPLARRAANEASVPGAWQGDRHLLRRLALLLDGATRAELPARAIGGPRPLGAFRVVERDGRLYGDPANVDRYEPFLDALEAIEPAAMAAFVERLSPLLDEALAELGQVRPVRGVALDAIDRVLDAPRESGPFELVRPNVLYQYADPSLEALPRLDKQLLRLSPRQRTRLDGALRELRAALVRP